MLIIIAAKITGVLLRKSLSQLHNDCNSHGINNIVNYLNYGRQFSILKELPNYDWNANNSQEIYLR